MREQVLETERGCSTRSMHKPPVALAFLEGDSSVPIPLRLGQPRSGAIGQGPKEVGQ